MVAKIFSSPQRGRKKTENYPGMSFRSARGKTVGWRKVLSFVIVSLGFFFSQCHLSATTTPNVNAGGPKDNRQCKFINCVHIFLIYWRGPILFDRSPYSGGLKYSREVDQNPFCLDEDAESVHHAVCWLFHLNFKSERTLEPRWIIAWRSVNWVRTLSREAL